MVYHLVSSKKQGTRKVSKIDMKHIKNLSIEKLLQLKGEIVLNSVFLADYRNTFDIDESEAYDFFSSYVEYLDELAKENGEGLDIFDLVKKYDTKENLEAYR